MKALMIKEKTSGLKKQSRFWDAYNAKALHVTFISASKSKFNNRNKLIIDEVLI